MSRDQGPAKIWAEYIGARLMAMGLQMFDADASLRGAAAVGRAIHRIDARHRERALRHLTLAFPDLSDQQRRRIVRASFEHFVQLALEVLHSPRRLAPQSWPAHVQLERFDRTIELFCSRRPFLMLTGHLGNWEVLGSVLTAVGFSFDVLARPLDNPLINRWLMDIRCQRGMRVIPKWDASDRMVEALDAGRALAFIADQNAGDKGLFVPFFGRLASAYKSIGLLAITQNVPIVCGYAHRLGGRFCYAVGEADVIEPDDWQDQPDPLYYITARYTRAIEQMVRMRPEQYLWMHRRWRSRPRHEARGKAMPASLQRQLEQLPWMDEAQLAELQKPLPFVDQR